LLQRFAPELVINSAGQDNHFTDPLANMQVSSQGYAKLTAELKPDLAVLEGGYAIETALPYVNLGILLALAGQDYSKVIEPHYRQVELKQAADTTSYIDKLITYWQNTLSAIPPDKEKLFCGKLLYKGISIPLYACSKCEEFAYELWHKEKNEKVYECYYLQDKKNDQYLMEQARK
jgi:hypothetical protein